MSGECGACAGYTPDVRTTTVASTPSSILLWDAGEVVDPPASPCCLRTTSAGSRAAVYRTGSGGGVVALVDFTAGAEERPGGGWHAPCVVRPLERPVPRSELLADDLLAPVFRHLRGRRRFPEPAARRLMALLDPQDAAHPL